MNRIVFTGLVFSLCLVPAVITFPLSAGAETEAGLSLSPIVVTATKRESRATEVPASINTQDAAFLQDFGIDNTWELTRFVPNLFYKKSAAGDAFVSRGISTMDPSLFSPMGLYVNDMAYPLSYMQEQPLFDVERVEVLRGPQSTLYGKNSSSGVINVVMAEPDNNFKAKIVTGAGNENTFTGGAMISGPLKKDQLYLGLSISALDTDGFLENVLNGDDEAGDDRLLNARGTLRWTPTENADITLALDVMDRDFGIPNLRYDTGPFATEPYKSYSNIGDRSEQDSFGQALKFKYRLAAADLLSITSHRRFNKLHILDADRSPVDMGFFSVIDIKHDSWSQEFRLTSREDSELSWLAGLYAGRDSLDLAFDVNHVLPLIASTRTTDVTSEEVAVFGQATLALTEALDITAGLRVDYASAEGDQVYTSYTGSVVFKDDLSDTQLLPMAALSYGFTDGIKGYALFSTGFLAGEYDHYTTNSNDNFAYDPEYTRNYEIGVKAALFDNRVQANLSLFYTTIDDKQVKEEVPGGGWGAWKITNAARAHTTGAELEIRAMPLANVELFAGLGYARTEIDDWTETVDGIPMDYSGNHLPWAPDLTATVGVGYYSNNGLYSTASLFWAGKQYFDAANTLSESGYMLANLKVGYRTDQFDISLYGKNVFDEEYLQKKTAMAGDILVEDGTPRKFGVELSWRF